MSRAARALHSTQLRALKNPNRRNRSLAAMATAVELGQYRQPQRFLRARRDQFGPNFATMGRLVVSDWDDVRTIIDSPQARGTGIVLAPWFASWRDMPTDFLLFVSDKEAGGPTVPETGKGVHAALHDHIWHTLLEPVQAVLWSAERSELHHELDQMVDDLVATAAGMAQPIEAGTIRPFVNELVIRFTLWAVLRLRPTDDEVAAFAKLYCDNAWIISRNATIGPAIARAKKVDEALAACTELVASSPVLVDYRPSPDNNHLTKEQFAELVCSIIGFAAIGGGGVTSNAALKLVPEGTALDTDEDAVNAILETARLTVPVGNITIITRETRSWVVDGEAVELPAGTTVSASYVLSSCDPELYPDPDEFDPDRAGLREFLTVFSSAGYQFEGAPHRTCPGRNVSIYMMVQLIRKWHAAGLAPVR